MAAGKQSNWQKDQNSFNPEDDLVCPCSRSYMDGTLQLQILPFLTVSGRMADPSSRAMICPNLPMMLLELEESYCFEWSATRIQSVRCLSGGEPFDQCSFI
jgi:hypothetical protein